MGATTQTWGQLLRSIRKRRGLGLLALGNRVDVSESLLSLIERGLRRPTFQLAQRLDRALGTQPLLETMFVMEEETDVKRRTTVGLALGFGALGLPLGALSRDSHLEPVPAGADLDAMVAGFSRQFVVNADEEFGRTLREQLTLLLRQVDDKGTPDRLRAASRLAQLFGLWLGNAEDFAQADGWYSMAEALAERSGDKALHAWTLARTANRTLFEGATHNAVTTGVNKAMSLTGARPTVGMVEGFAAITCISALTGNLAGGRVALERMTEGAHALKGSAEVPNLPERADLHRAYLLARLGTEAEAMAACDTNLRTLAGLPYWRSESEMYRAKAMVGHGDVQGGLSYAVSALRFGGIDPTGVIKVAIRDVVMTAPRDTRSDDLDLLKSLAATRPGPWEMIAA